MYQYRGGVPLTSSSKRCSYGTGKGAWVLTYTGQRGRGEGGGGFLCLADRHNRCVRSTTTPRTHVVPKHNAVYFKHAACFHFDFKLGPCTPWTVSQRKRTPPYTARPQPPAAFACPGGRAWRHRLGALAPCEERIVRVGRGGEGGRAPFPLPWANRPRVNKEKRRRKGRSAQ